MFEKKLLLFKSLFFGLILASSFSFVIASSNLFSSKITVVFQNSEKIFPDSLDLNTLSIVFKSSKKIDEQSISSKCSIHTDLVDSVGDLYLFNIKFFDDNCSKIVVDNKTEEGKLNLNISLISDYDIVSKFIDYNDERIESNLDIINQKLSSSVYKKYLLYKGDSNLKNNEKYFKAARLVYVKNIIENILSKRSEKYSIPVEGNYSISSEHSKVPNAGRPYRDSYTDGIHHGWDIDAPFGEKVISLDDGVIIRVVDEFNDSDFDRIVYGEDLTENDKLKNLDILRGKQVWLKTMKGDVVFYSHLDEIYSHLKEGIVVSKGSPIGTIGVSGIPGYSEYDDYHLHFAIHKNPYNDDTAGKYDFLDYMKWDWYFKGESREYILENQKHIFE